MTTWLEEVPNKATSVKSKLPLKFLMAGGKLESNPYTAAVITFVAVVVVMCITRPPFCVWQNKKDEESVPKLQGIVLLWGVLGGVIAALLVHFL